MAAYPPPPNDTPASAQVIGTLPAVVEGRNVRGDNTINNTTLTGLTSVPGPDVFYSFTPAATGSYWIVMIPWTQVPVYASGGAGVPLPNLCVYIRRVDDGVFVAGSDANGRDLPDTIVATLVANTEYEIVVDSRETDPRGQEFEFTLVVSPAPSGSSENCAAGATIPFGDFPYARVNTLTGAVNDYSFIEGTGRCDIVDTTGLAVAGPDHVYEFTTGPDPSAAGDYMINLVPAGQSWDGFVYVVDSCPPFLPIGCIGAASHTSIATRQSEAVVVTLDYDTTYYIVVEAATTVLPNARYVLLIDRAEGYGINEFEGNDAPTSATPLDAAAPNGGQVLGAADVDFWSLAAAAGDRLYVAVDVGNALLSSIDSELRLIAPDGVGVIEYDDDDGEGSTSPIATLVFRQSSFASTIAGALLAAAGEYFLQVDSLGLATHARYRLHYGIEPAGRLPSPECESNNAANLADQSAKDYFNGVIDPQGDVDYYTFDALAGERIYIAVDGDPERNSGGDATNDPQALNAALQVLDPAGDVLITNHNDSNAVDAGQIPDYPAEALVFVAPLSGSYTVRVSGGDPNTAFGPERTYHLAIFRNDAAPALDDDRDPVIDSIAPNFGTDTLTVNASDDATGDSGLCAAALAAGSTNLQLLGASITPGDPTATFQIGLVNPAVSGAGKLTVVDCAGNTACAWVTIDATLPTCNGTIVSPTARTFRSTHEPLHVRDNEPSGPGIYAELPVDLPGIITDINATVTCETTRANDIDVFLISPSNATIALFNDKGGSGAFDITDATFDDSASQTMPTTDGAEPYTGTWLPDQPLATFIGQQAAGTWRLNVRDDSSLSSGGSRLVRWSLEISAGYPNPQYFTGSASDVGGLASVALSGDTNLALAVDPSFIPGDTSVSYTVTLIDPSQNGSGDVVVTDLSQNTCVTPISLSGLADTIAPLNAGGVTRNITVGAEAQLDVPSADPAGAFSAADAPPLTTSPIASVEVRLTVNTLDVGRIAAGMNGGSGGVAVLLNRTGMTERDSVGLTKDNFDLLLSDDAPAVDDAHLEPALSSIEFIGLHQPDGRGQFFGNAITSDYRDNMLFALEGLPPTGTWSVLVTDNRLQGASAARSIFRRWKATVATPAAAEHYEGVASEPFPGAGICAIELAPGAQNLMVAADSDPREAPYYVLLVDPTQPGSGELVIRDCANNETIIPIALQPQLADQNAPVITVARERTDFSAVALDQAPGDSGIADVTLAPYATNLQVVSMTPNPPGGASSVQFTIGLIDPNQNGRGYVRVTDGVGHRRHALVHIDATPPVCTGSVGTTKRYVSTDPPQPLPDNNPSGVTSSIVVPDADRVADLNLTLNILHGFDDDVDVTLLSPVFMSLFGDIGLTGNDFIDTTLDQDADFVIPDSASAAPFTGSWQPLPPASLAIFESQPAAGTYTLQVADDKAYDLGTFLNWSITIESTTFPPRYDGRVQDVEPLGRGICSIALLPGAVNVDLNVDSFEPGAKIVRYGVSLVNPTQDGAGTVRVTDCAGNTCDVPVVLDVAGPTVCPGDADCDGDVDFFDIDPFVARLGCPGAGTDCDVGCPWQNADADADGDVDFFDIDPFVALLGTTCP